MPVGSVAEAGFTGTLVIATDLWAPMAMDSHVRAGKRAPRTD
jgi:hypothetical protein